MGRLQTLLRRLHRSRDLGFIFLGTRFTPLPRRLNLAGGSVDLAYPDDPAIISDIINVLMEDEYGLATLPGPVETIVDIGANIGLFSLWARHHFPDARILAFEPNPDVYDYAKRNTERLGVDLSMEAVGSERGAVRLFSPDESTRTVRALSDKDGKVPMITLDDVVARAGGRIDLLKLDCEGGEWEILKCAEALRKVKCVVMEYHLTGDVSVEQLLSTMSALNFQNVELDRNHGFGMARFVNAAEL